MLFPLVAVGLGFVPGCGGDESGRLPDADPPREAASEPGPVEASGTAAALDPYRALWVLCEGSQRVLEDAARVEVLIDRARALGASDLFVQVYRGGRAWYDSSLADAGPYRKLLETTGVDTLRQLIAQAHGAGIRVHAWVNVLSLSHNDRAPLLSDLGREVVLVDRDGRSVLDYPDLEVPPPDKAWYRMGTRGIYLDPAAPGVSERLTATFAELVERYPELDGLHLDYIRHPAVLPFLPGSRFAVGLDFGYGSASIQRFGRETGLSGPYRDPSQPDPKRLVNTRRWDDWRREKVSEIVALIREACLAKRPGLLVSAAVISYADRAYLSLYQDWRSWLEDGLLDFAVPMIYTRDDRLFRYQVESFAGGPNADRIWMGMGTWLFASAPAGALRQLELVRAAGSTGEALFSYDSLADAPELYQALVDEVTRSQKPALEEGLQSDP
jgi:uncharacterized lipoprotein YddW (UPF0748 family)